MKKQIDRRTSGYLLSLAVTAALATPASAYSLYSKDGSELNLDIEAVFGVFSSDENILLRICVP